MIISRVQGAVPTEDVVLHVNDKLLPSMSVRDETGLNRLQYLLPYRFSVHHAKY